MSFWKTIFPDAFVYCFDCDFEGEEDRGKVIRVDQSSLEELRRGAEQIKHPISLIVDDGSHHPSHQLLTFSFLFHDLLQSDGLYAIEDVETSYWRNASLYGYVMNYGLHDPWSAIEAFKLASDYVNRFCLSREDQSMLQSRMMSIGLDPEAVDSIESILFSRNCILVQKRTSEEPLQVDYGHADATSRFLEISRNELPSSEEFVSL